MKKFEHKCLQCGKTLKPCYETLIAPDGIKWLDWAMINPNYKVGLYCIGRQGTENIFCTDKCAVRYAVEEVKNMIPLTVELIEKEVREYDKFLKSQYEKKKDNLIKGWIKLIQLKREESKKRIAEL